MNCTTNCVTQFLILQSYLLCSAFFKYLRDRQRREGIASDQKRWHIATTLSSNGHEKTKETSKYNFKKENRDPEKST